MKTLLKSCLIDLTEPNYPRRFQNAFTCQVTYTDTDSLLYMKAEEEDVYKLIKKHSNQALSTTDYPSKNVYGILLFNKKVLGNMKDEE